MKKFLNIVLFCALWFIQFIIPSGIHFTILINSNVSASNAMSSFQIFNIVLGIIVIFTSYFIVKKINESKFWKKLFDEK